MKSVRGSNGAAGGLHSTSATHCNCQVVAVFTDQNTHGVTCFASDLADSLKNTLFLTETLQEEDVFVRCKCVRPSRFCGGET